MPTMSPRLPYVPPPAGRSSVSPCNTCTSAGVTPRASAAIWTKVVSDPCPWGEIPVYTRTCPVGLMRAQETAEVIGNVTGKALELCELFTERVKPTSVNGKPYTDRVI